MSVNKELLHCMKQQSLGEAFNNLAPFLKLYSTYAGNFEQATSTLKVYSCDTMLAKCVVLGLQLHMYFHSVQHFSVITGQFVHVNAVRASLQTISGKHNVIPPRASCPKIFTGLCAWLGTAKDISWLLHCLKIHHL